MRSSTGACLSDVVSLRKTNPKNLLLATHRLARSLVDVTTTANSDNNDQQYSVIDGVNDSVIANPEAKALTSSERS